MKWSGRREPSPVDMLWRDSRSEGRQLASGARTKLLPLMLLASWSSNAEAQALQQDLRKIDVGARSVWLWGVKDPWRYSLPLGEAQLRRVICSNSEFRAKYCTCQENPSHELCRVETPTSTRALDRSSRRALDGLERLLGSTAGVARSQPPADVIAIIFLSETSTIDNGKTFARPTNKEFVGDPFVTTTRVSTIHADEFEDIISHEWAHTIQCVLAAERCVSVFEPDKGQPPVTSTPETMIIRDKRLLASREVAGDAGFFWIRRPHHELHYSPRGCRAMSTSTTTLCRELPDDEYSLGSVSRAYLYGQWVARADPDCVLIGALTHRVAEYPLIDEWLESYRARVTCPPVTEPPPDAGGAVTQPPDGGSDASVEAGVPGVAPPGVGEKGDGGVDETAPSFAVRPPLPAGARKRPATIDFGTFPLGKSAPIRAYRAREGLAKGPFRVFGFSDKRRWVGLGSVKSKESNERLAGDRGRALEARAKNDGLVTRGVVPCSEAGEDGGDDRFLSAILLPARSSTTCEDAVPRVEARAKELSRPPKRRALRRPRRPARRRTTGSRRLPRSRRSRGRASRRRRA